MKLTKRQKKAIRQVMALAYATENKMFCLNLRSFSGVPGAWWAVVMFAKVEIPLTGVVAKHEAEETLEAAGRYLEKRGGLKRGEADVHDELTDMGEVTKRDVLPRMSGVFPLMPGFSTPPGMSWDDLRQRINEQLANMPPVEFKFTHGDNPFAPPTDDNTPSDLGPDDFLK